MFTLSIIDDDQTILMGLEHLIKTKITNEINIYTFLSSEAALVSDKLEQSNLIITDITMGEIDGLDMLSILHNRNYEFEAIVISAHQDFSYAQKSIDLKVLSYLTKPINFDKLIEQIKMLYSMHKSTTDTNYSKKQPEIINFLLDYISNHYMNNITLKGIAEEFHYNPSYLGRLFNKHLGKSFNTYLQETRINNAKELLLNSDLPIDEISYMIGIPHTSYFSSIFKESTGYSPLKFRQNE